MANSRRDKIKKRRARRRLFIMLLTFIAIAFGYFAGESYVRASVADEVIIEAEGVPVIIDQFDSSGQGTLLTDIGAIDFNSPGEYLINIKKYFYTVTSKLIVKDTEPPKGTAVDMTIWKGEGVSPETLVKDIADQTSVTVDFKEQPDFSKAGKQEVTLILKDEGNNITEVVSKVTVIEDKEPPVIRGVKDIITVYAGDTISYRTDVTVQDNSNREIELKIDSSGVDNATPGDYTVVYSASDGAGNVATRKAVVKVMQKKVTEEEVYALADKVLSKIIDSSMDKEQKAKAIYNWVENNIGYVAKPTTYDWLTAAYDGFTKKKADCYIYYSVSRALLTRADIENVEIIREDKGHYWNLVKTDEGWFHFDTTPRVGGGEFCLLKDSELKAYSVKHKNSHLFDTSSYPRTP